MSTPVVSSANTEPGLAAALAYSRQAQASSLSELMAFLRIPSVGTQPERAADTAAAADWLVAAMVAAGLEHCRTIPTPRHPLVYGDWLHAGPDAPTVLIYGHYDVQPADPLELWQSPPFAPEVRDNYLYARGAADDKGQFFIHLKAIEALLRGVGRLPVNVKVIAEGEEESGGASLAAFIPENGDLLAADVALISDTAILSPDQPALVYGLRGMCYLFVDVTGPAHDLHSGSYGGGINNPINALAWIISKLKDEQGHVQIPGFYDAVQPLTERERQLLAQFPLVEVDWLATSGAPQSWGEPEYNLVERLGARPTLDVNGIIGGYTGEGAKTVLPAHVHAKISMRLVPDQQPLAIFRLFSDYVRAIAPPSVTVNVTYGHGSPPAITNLDHPAMAAAAIAYERVFGRAPVYMREGGTIPVVANLQDNLGLESVLMGFALPDDRVHSPNERFYLPNFYRGIETAIHFLTLYGGAGQDGG
jgi:acetylornithine deacetylase/succinyl-diaminopimelate desuccinylase-like protein